MKSLVQAQVYGLKEFTINCSKLRVSLALKNNQFSLLVFDNIFPSCREILIILFSPREDLSYCNMLKVL